MDGMVVNGVLWLLDPHEKFGDATNQEIAEACGLLPHFLDRKDGRTPREQFEANYQFGVHEMRGGTITDDGTYQYPQDPDLVPYMYAEFGNERVYIYRSGIVGIVNRETGDQFLTRMD